MACTFSTSQLPKVVPDSQLFNTFDFQTRHKDVHFLNISTAQSAPRMVCFFKFLGKIIDGSRLTCISLDPLMLLSRNSFAEISRSSADNPCTCRQRPKIWSSGHRIPRGNKAAGAFHFECVIGFFSHFDFEMRFAPQPCALFQQINFQKRSNTEVLCALWVPHALRTTTPCTFWTAKLPKVLRTWGVFGFWQTKLLRATTAYNFSSLIWPNGSAPAALASLLFNPPESQNIGKTHENTALRDFSTFSRT